MAELSHDPLLALLFVLELLDERCQVMPLSEVVVRTRAHVLIFVADTNPQLVEFDLDVEEVPKDTSKNRDELILGIQVRQILLFDHLFVDVFQTLSEAVSLRCLVPVDVFSKAGG